MFSNLIRRLSPKTSRFNLELRLARLEVSLAELNAKDTVPQQNGHSRTHLNATQRSHAVECLRAGVAKEDTAFRFGLSLSEVELLHKVQKLAAKNP